MATESLLDSHIFFFLFFFTPNLPSGITQVIFPIFSNYSLSNVKSTTFITKITVAPFFIFFL